MWLAISRFGVIGPYFFEENLNGELYRDVILEQFWLDLQNFCQNHGKN